MEGAQKGDDGFSFLTPTRYIEIRLEDQLSYYSKKTPKLGAEIKQMQTAILVAGGLGTLLAATGAELCVALTTSLATALTSSVPSRQLEETLVRYNQSAADIANVRDWWTKLSAASQQAEKENCQVDCERIAPGAGEKLPSGAAVQSPLIRNEPCLRKLKKTKTKGSRAATFAQEIHKCSQNRHHLRQLALPNRL